MTPLHRRIALLVSRGHTIPAITDVLKKRHPDLTHLQVKRRIDELGWMLHDFHPKLPLRARITLYVKEGK